MSAPPAIPDHALLRPIGRGAFGEVWLARNVMGTLRAVKIIWRRHFDSERPFEREFAGIQRFEPVSRTSGGLVHVLHVGRNDAEGYFYYVMELADDAAQNLRSETTPGSTRLEASVLESGIPDFYQSRTLRSDLKRFGRLSTADCLRLAMEVAGGLAQLHRHGLVHRDVKPGNIIYVNDRAKLADVGLVTIEGEARTFVGTEGYVPPEGPGSPAADIYALGIVLYQASTGLSPERLPDVPPEWFRDPEGDSALELHEIVLKASEAQRERRYASADAMQADIALLQSGQSVRHARALRRRYARLRIMGAVGTVFLALALGSAFLANYRARLAAEDRAKEARLRQDAQVAQARAEKAEGEARRQFQMALFEEARALVLSKELGHRTRALEAIRMSEGATNAPELRRLAFAALSLPDLRLEREIPMSEPVAVGMDPKLEQIALTGGQEVTVLSVPDFHVVATLPPSTANEALDMRWSADSRFLAVNRQYKKPGAGSDLEVWNVSQSRLLLAVRADIARDAFSFHPKRPLLMAAHIGGAISVWDLNSGREERPFSFPGTASALAYSPDGERVAASYQRGSNWVVAFQSAKDGAQLSEVSCAEPASRIAWHPLGQWVSIIGQRSTEWNRGVRLISPESGEVVLLGKHKIKAAGISFSPDGNYLMSCGWERELICWDLRTRQRAFSGADAGYEMFWSSTGLRCATVTRDRPRLQLYSFDPPVCQELTGNRGERLGPGAFSPDGRWLAVPDSENLCVWNSTGTTPAVLLEQKPRWPPFFSTNGAELFVVDGTAGDLRLNAWRIDSDESLAEPPRLTPLPIAPTPGLEWAGLAGDTLVTTSTKGVRLIPRSDAGTVGGRFIRVSAGLGAISSDGKRLALTYNYSPSVTVHSLPEMNELAHLDTAHFVSGCWFSPAGDELTVINRGGIERWNTLSWRRKWRESGSPRSDSYVLYAPDGSGMWRVTGSRDTAFCDSKNLEPILPLPANFVPLAISSDGRQLAVSADDEHAQVWDLPKLRRLFGDLGLDWKAPQP